MMLVCLLLPGMVWAATPTVTWDSSQPNPYGIYEAWETPWLDHSIKIKTSTPLGNGESITVGFYWFSEVPQIHSNTDQGQRYTTDFIFQRVSNTQGHVRNSLSGSAEMVLTGDGSKTVFDRLNMQTSQDSVREDPGSVYLVLLPGSGYNLNRTNQHKEIIISDRKATTARWELHTPGGVGGVGNPVYFTLHTGDFRSVDEISKYSFQSRNHGSQDEWVEISSTQFCTARYGRNLCYMPQYSDLGKEIRLVVDYLTYQGNPHSYTSNVIGPIKKNTVRFEISEFRVNEGDTAQVKLAMDWYVHSAVTVRVSSTPLTATGNDVDYTGLTYSAAFAAWEKEKIISIPITKDNTVTNDSEADTESFRLDMYDGDFPNWLEAGSLAYVRIHNYKLPIISLTDIDRVTDERTYTGLALSSNRDVPYAEAVTVQARAKAKNGTTFDLSGSLFGRVGVSSTDRVPFASEDTLYCAWLPQSTRHYTVSDRSATEPATGWSICPSGVTILVKNTGTTAQEEANQRANPDPEPPKVMNSINDCVHSGNLSLHQVEDFAQNRSPADNRFNRILSALYERTTPAPLTASEANVFYQNNRGGDNESLYEAVYNTLTCIEAL